MKKFIQASAVSGICLSLPQAKPMKISPKYGSARLRTSIIEGSGMRLTYATWRGLCIPLNGAEPLLEGRNTR